MKKETKRPFVPFRLLPTKRTERIGFRRCSASCGGIIIDYPLIKVLSQQPESLHRRPSLPLSLSAAPESTMADDGDDTLIGSAANNNNNSEDNAATTPLLFLLDGVLSQDEERVAQACTAIQKLLLPITLDITESPCTSPVALGHVLETLLHVHPHFCSTRSDHDGSLPLHFCASLGIVAVASIVFNKVSLCAFVCSKERNRFLAALALNLKLFYSSLFRFVSFYLFYQTIVPTSRCHTESKG